MDASALCSLGWSGGGGWRFCFVVAAVRLRCYFYFFWVVLREGFNVCVSEVCAKVGQKQIKAFPFRVLPCFVLFLFFDTVGGCDGRYGCVLERRHRAWPYV